MTKNNRQKRSVSKKREIIGIAAVTANGYIARHSNEQILWSKDLALFKKQTRNYPVIMGSNTYRTLVSSLPNREMVVVNRKDTPEDILKRIHARRCFVIGGGRTYTKFSSYLTHLYLTIHPLIFAKGISLFVNLEKKILISFIKMVPVVAKEGVFQFQYKVEQR